MQTATIIRILTIAALAGLLGAVGLRLTLGQVTTSLRQCRFIPIVLANFILVPALTVAATRLFGIDREIAIGMILLAAAPFAPVVPVFARMARSDLALAAGLTSVFPVLSAFLTPLVCQVSLSAVTNAEAIRFNLTGVLLTLVATITLPLAAGIAVHHWRPGLAKRLLRPVEIVSEGVGALSLAFVTFTELGSIFQTGWPALLAMVLIAEVSVGLGYWISGGAAASRQVVAFGTSNRNIALALLVAVQAFAGTPVLSAVVANGLLLILLGLGHVAYWRFIRPSQPA